MYDDFQIISANLKYLREKSGYTQEQLAEITGLSVSHISKVEAGLRRVGMKTYISILQALNVEGNDYINLAVKDSNENNIKQYLAMVICLKMRIRRYCIWTERCPEMYVLSLIKD